MEIFLQTGLDSQLTDLAVPGISADFSAVHRRAKAEGASLSSMNGGLRFR
jgi:hypothetical protein